jgi:hypothetical protein
MHKRLIIVFFVILMTCIINTKPAGAENEMLVISGFRVSHELTIPGHPKVVYDAITGDISGWWDHSFSEKPAKFYIEAWPGGGFYELFNDSGDGVKHATVIMAQRGKILRFEGPLGLSGRALHIVHTYDFSAQGPDSTHLRLTLNAIGEVNQQLAETVDRVWYHFLFEQFKPYMIKLINHDN